MKKFNSTIEQTSLKKDTPLWSPLSAFHLSRKRGRPTRQPISPLCSVGVCCEHSGNISSFRVFRGQVRLITLLVGLLTLCIAAAQKLNAQQATSKTMSGSVGIVIESPVDSSQLQPYLKTIRQNPGSEQAAQARLAIAKLQFDNWAYNAALEDLRKVVQDYPKGGHSEEAAFYLTAALSRTYHDEEAVTEATEALAQYPNGPWSDGERYFLGRSYYRLGQSDLALAQLNSIVGKSAGGGNSTYRDDALKLISDTYKHAKQYDRAIESLRKIVAESKDQSNRNEAQLEIGWLYSVNNQIEAAVAEYQKAANMDVSVAARAGYETGYVHLNRGDYTKAREAFQQVADQYPTDLPAGQAGRFGSQASLRVGYCLVESGEYESALQQLEKTDATYPDFDQRDLLLWYKAMSYRGLDQLELAKLIATVDTTFTNYGEFKGFLMWYEGILDKRLEHLEQAKKILDELVASYPKSAFVKAAEDTHGQVEQTMKELEIEKERTSKELQNQGTSKQDTSKQATSQQETSNQGSAKKGTSK
jgi:tetratricopeptide (TPR) repeat protein